MQVRRSVRTVARSGVVAAAVLGVVSAGGTSPAGAMSAVPGGGDPAARGESVGFGVDGKSSSHLLAGVAAIAADDVMAVGTGADLTTRAPHWDGDQWKGTRPPVGLFSTMRGVAAVSSTDVWGVGAISNNSLAAHWDGKDWTQATTPPPDQWEDDLLLAVAAARSDDVWAVGYSRLDDGGSYVEPLILHWDGTTWAKTAYELPPEHKYGSLDGVTVISPNDAWAVGHSSSTVESGPLMLHWNGRSWKPSPPPVVRALSETIDGLRAVDGVASDDVWASGYGGGDALLHWDGTVWTSVPPPVSEQRGGASNLYGLAAVASDDVWTVGGYDGEPFYDFTRILHWDGKSWTEVKSPNPGSDGNVLNAVSAIAPDDIWAVGRFNNKPDAYQHLFVHWDGHRWTRVRTNGDTHHAP